MSPRDLKRHTIKVRWKALGLSLLILLATGCSLTPSYSKLVSSIRTLHVEVQQSSPSGGEDLPIKTTLERVIREFGVQAADPSSPADATLRIELEFTPLPAEVIGSGTCYLGAKSNGALTLTPSEGKTVTLRLADTLEAAPKEGVRLVYSCPDPSEAPREKVWLKPVFGALARLWGNALLVTAVQDADAQVATTAAFLLTEPSRRDTLVQAAPFLVKRLEDNNDVLRRQVVDTIAEAGPDVPGVIPALIQVLDTDEDLYTRERAATALGEMGVKAVEAVPSLIQALQDPYTQVCDAAVLALANLGSDAAPAVPALLQALEQGECTHVRVIIALRKIGPAALEAVPSVITMLSDSTFHDFAHDALKEITGQDLGEDPGPWQDWWSKQ